MEGNMIPCRRGEYIVGHIQLWLKVGPIVSLARLHMMKTKVSYHVLSGRPWLHEHQLVPSTYHQCVKGRLNDRMIRIVANPSPFERRRLIQQKLCSTTNGIYLGKAQRVFGLAISITHISVSIIHNSKMVGLIAKRLFRKS